MRAMIPAIESGRYGKLKLGVMMMVTVAIIADRFAAPGGQSATSTATQFIGSTHHF
jgi:hypothetical protein